MPLIAVVFNLLTCSTKYYMSSSLSCEKEWHYRDDEGIGEWSRCCDQRIAEVQSTVGLAMPCKRSFRPRSSAA